MADRVEREIEEILARLEDQAPPGEKKPISILSRRKHGPGGASRAKRSAVSASHRLNPTTMMFAGAAIVVGGLILSNAWPVLIWASFAGVVLFLGAFVSSFFREAPASAPKQRGVYWRDRYIEYEPAHPGLLSRLRRRLRH